MRRSCSRSGRKSMARETKGRATLATSSKCSVSESVASPGARRRVFGSDSVASSSPLLALMPSISLSWYPESYHASLPPHPPCKPPRHERGQARNRPRYRLARRGRGGGAERTGAAVGERDVAARGGEL